MAKKPVVGSTTTIHNAPKKVYLQSLGCPKNLVDSEIMLGQLATQGFELTQNQKEAEVIIVNTCGFLQSSVKESINTILDLSKEKKSGSCEKLVVTGCLSQRYQGELPKELQEVDLFIGTNDYAEIGRVLSRVPPSREYIHPPLYVHTSDTPRLLATASHIAYVKIAEGCNHTCSFCIIPKLRGKQRSRAIADIVAEVKNLQSMEVKEFNLIAQDTTDYGYDLHDGTNIEKLFTELAKISGDHWFRLMYAYPLRFSDELIDIIASSPNFCRYVDIPFQHISDRILKSMHRGSNGAYIRRFVERIRGKIPDVGIRSTFIVGYPGETETEFQELAHFLEDAELERVGVFTYSHEEGTEAADLSDQVSEKVKKERRRILMERQQEISLKKNRGRLGKKLKVLADRPFGSGRAVGRTEWDAPDIDGNVELKGKGITAGNFYEVTVTGATPYTLFAEI
ncbi:MAG: 30S ribosomal protein S12 methylthiotransferase RimO [Deltaproteobacteria bacterium]|nr:30S ribosomal protein S12 methylthiotransferase RimO [Deltaproteobacteria bacterium]